MKKTYTPMKVSLVGKVTEVVMGGRKHSGPNGDRNSSYSSWTEGDKPGFGFN